MSEPLFRKLLIANRGEIAVRVLRTCRKLGIGTAVVYSDADASSIAVQEADEAFHLGPSRVQESYLSFERLAAAIDAVAPDAVHPGYGLLSEEPRFAELVQERGATFIGPSPDALRAFGDKITARRLAAQAGLKPPPGSEAPVDATNQQAVLELARSLGYPLMVKAAGGGGGIGMARATEEAELLQAVEVCANRGRAAFGDDRVYIERWIERARHLEVQVARDRHGRVVAYGDRECSAQRRHQKIIEECPSPAAFLTSDVREVLYEGAKTLIAEVDYVGVATVEFIADCSRTTPEIYFLEVNARIQVEHPVTEMVFDLDLVQTQLELAAGKQLAPFSLESSKHGHAIEARLYAEDPSRNFLPQPGVLEQLEWPDLGSKVRIDAGYQAGDTVTPYYDPLIAKVIGHGATREEARVRLADALSKTRLELRGPKGLRTTNLEFLCDLLQSPRLKSGDYDTGLAAEVSEGTVK